MTETMWHDLQEALGEALQLARAGKTADRSEAQRRLAILTTDLEKCVAWAKYTVYAEDFASNA